MTQLVYQIYTDQTTVGGVIMSYRFSRWRPLWRNFTSGFRLGDVALSTKVKLSKSIGKPNVVGITQSTAEI